MKNDLEMNAEFSKLEKLLSSKSFISVLILIMILVRNLCQVAVSFCFICIDVDMDNEVFYKLWDFFIFGILVVVLIFPTQKYFIFPQIPTFPWRSLTKRIKTHLIILTKK
jgi:hypothetical protein